MERIDRGQLSVLLVLFLCGSAWLFALGAEARHRSWMAVLLGLIIGLGVLWVHLRLQHHFPGQSLVQFLPRIVGRPLGWLLSICYIAYFLYIAARVTRDFGELALIAVLPETPIAVLVGLHSLVVAYAVRMGLEPLTRATTIMLGLGVGLIFLGTLLALPRFDPSNLRPLLGPDLWRVWEGTFPLTITVPFGEAVVFLMIYRSVAGEYRRETMVAMAAAGLFLTYLTLFELGVLGPFITQTSQFPLLELIRQVSVADVFDRLDPTVVILLTLGGFLKVSVFFYAAVLGLAHLFGLRRYGRLVLPMAGILAPLSLSIAADYGTHISVGMKLVPYIMHLPMQIGLPVLLLLTWEVRRLMGWRGVSSRGEGA